MTIDVTPEQKRQEWREAGYSPVRTDAFIRLFNERRKLAHSAVHLATHEKFGIKPKTCAQFALNHAAVFRGDATYSHARPTGTLPHTQSQAHPGHAQRCGSPLRPHTN